ELLDRSAKPLQLGTNLVVIARKEGLQILRIEPFPLRGGPDQVAEQCHYDLALLARPRSLHDQRSSARAAEAEPFRVLLAAARAHEHGQSLRPSQPSAQAWHRIAIHLRRPSTPTNVLYPPRQTSPHPHDHHQRSHKPLQACVNAFSCERQ